MSRRPDHRLMGIAFIVACLIIAAGVYAIIRSPVQTNVQQQQQDTQEAAADRLMAAADRLGEDKKLQDEADTLDEAKYATPPRSNDKKSLKAGGGQVTADPGTCKGNWISGEVGSQRSSGLQDPSINILVDDYSASLFRNGRRELIMAFENVGDTPTIIRFPASSSQLYDLECYGGWATLYLKDADGTVRDKGILAPDNKVR